MFKNYKDLEVGRVSYLMLLSAGLGERSMPLNLRTEIDRMPKSLIQVLEKPIVEYLVEGAKQMGMNDVLLYAYLASNRRALYEHLGDGSKFDINLSYSQVSNDFESVGSATALFRELTRKNPAELCNKYKYVLVQPNDNYMDGDFVSAIQDHILSGAMMTMLTVEKDATSTINKYGFALPKDGWLRSMTEWAEKPKNLEQLCELMGKTKEEVTSSKADVNTAAYVIDLEQFQKLAEVDWVKELITLDRAGELGGEGFGIGPVLIPRMLAEGIHIRTQQIKAWLDFGSRDEYHQNVINILKEAPNSLTDTLELSKDYRNLGNNTWVHQRVLSSYVNGSQKTALEHIKNGKMAIGPNVRIGPDVVLNTGVIIQNSNLDTRCEVGKGAEIYDSQISSFSIVGQGAIIDNSVLGYHCVIDSSLTSKTGLHKVFMGAECIVPKGVYYNNLVVAPRINFNDEHHKGRNYGDLNSETMFINHENDYVKKAGTIIRK